MRLIRFEAWSDFDDDDGGSMRHPTTPPAPYPQVPPEFRYMLPPMFILPLALPALNRSFAAYYDKLYADLMESMRIPDHLLRGPWT